MRYDWPRGPKLWDNPDARAAHNARLRPPAGSAPAGSAAADAAPADAAAASPATFAPHDLPAGDVSLWTPIGPSVMTNGQADRTPNVAGRIRDLQVDPVAGQRIYVASASGGVWFSANAGASWNPVDDWQQTPDRSAIGVVANALACGALYVLWGGQADGSADEVWVGTGELHGGAGGSPSGQISGIGFLHRSAGAGWQVVKGGDPTTDPDSLDGETVYRIVADHPADPDPAHPAPRQLVAATSKGVYLLPAGGSWTRSTGWPASGAVADHQPVDVLTTRTATAVRVWVVEYGHLWVAEAGLAVAIDQAPLVFTEIPVPGSVSGRMALAATPDGTSVYVLGQRPKTAAEIAAAPGQDPTPVADLWQVNAAAAVGSLAATELPGAVPTGLFGKQANYDMCIAVHPARPQLVYVGGCTTFFNGDWNAAVYVVDTSVHPYAPVWLGDGAHADDHILRFGAVSATHAPKLDLWLGCDGGVFRSDSDGDPGTFAAVNDGLAVLQAGYVSSHPSNPGVVAAGFQDNGTAHRIGDTVWRQRFGGDGGGIAWDPDLTGTSRYLRQYTQSTWQSSDLVTLPPVQRITVPMAATLVTSEAKEDKASAFYSGCDAVTLGPGDTHIAIGTHRVWYSADFGVHWVTAPTGTDPRNGNPLDTQDVYHPQVNADSSTCSSDPPSLGTGIIAVKLATPAPTPTASRLRAIALYQGGLVWHTGTRPLASPHGAFTWDRPTDAAPTPVQAFRAPKSGDETTAFTGGSPLHFLPAPGRVSDFAVHDPDLGPLGSCYVTTTGAAPGDDATTQQHLDTLWFFDGTDMWYPCGFRTANADRGVWTGTQIAAAALGVVVDSVIVDVGHTDRSVVYVATSVGVVRGVLTIIGGPSFSWTWTLVANGLPEAAVQDLSIHTYNGGSIRLLRAALQARGVWETDLANPTSTPLTFLRAYATDTRRIVPTPLTGQTVVGDPGTPRWDGSPDIVLDVTGTTPANPSELQLLMLPTNVGVGVPTAAVAPARRMLVQVLVHHRGGTPVTSADLRVALVRHDIPAGGTVPLGGLWGALAGAASPPVQLAALPDGWAVAAGQLWQSPPGPAAGALLPPVLEGRRPLGISFDVTFPPELAAGTAQLLVAVVMTSTGQVITTTMVGADVTTVEQLVSASPKVAALSVTLT